MLVMRMGRVEDGVAPTIPNIAHSIELPSPREHLEVDVWLA
jgi:hypothetical protein